MAKIKFYLDCRYKDGKSGCFPLKISVAHDYKVRYVSLDLRLRECEWNARDQLVTSRHATYRKVNNWLSDILDKAEAAAMELTMKGGRRSAMDYADCIDEALHGGNKKRRSETFSARLLRFAALKKDSTRQLYEFTLKRMRDYCEGVDALGFEDIDREWLTGFDRYLAQSSNSQNYRNIHLRNIRAVFNNALDDEVTTAYPFRRLKIRPVETEKRSLSVEKLRELFDYSGEPHQGQYVDMFKLMFMLCGINAADLFGLRSLVDGRAVYHRAKTGKLYSVKVEPEAMEIIERWRGRDFLLDVRDRYADYRNYTHRMNLNLRRLGSVVRSGLGGRKIIEPAFPGLSTYWARHSWATVAAELDVPDATISRALGHASENSTTEIYIKRNRQKVDEANRRVLDWVLYGRR